MVLVAVAFANLVVAALHFGLAAAAPLLRDLLELDAAQLGLLLAAPPLGLMLGTFAWGELADRMSERRVLTLAFVGFSVSTLGAARLADDAVMFGSALLLAGLFGSAAHSAGGRAIAAAFPPQHHGLVLAIRHTAIPVGGALGGIAVPLLVRSDGLATATAWAAGLGALATVGIALALPSSRRPEARAAVARAAPAGGTPLRERRLWLLAAGAACLAFVQLGVGSFLTVQLVDEAKVGIAVAAGVFTATQLLGAIGRILLGAWSDRSGDRIRILRGVAAAAGALAGVATLVPAARADAVLLAAALVVVTSCNGVVVATAASLAPTGRTGATLGMQTTANAAACTIAPVVLGALLATAGWAAFELALVVVLVASSACLAALARR